MKVLIVGLGSIAAKHIKALHATSPLVEIFALRSSKNAHKESGVKNLYSYQEINFKPDFVIVSNPTSEHYNTLKQVSALNCPVFIEKPSLSRLDGSETLIKTFKEMKIMTYVGFCLRFLSCLRFVKDNLSKNAHINEVNVYCGSYLPDWRPGTDFRKNYSSQAHLGGGVHLDLIHELDYVYWFFGNPQKSERRLKSSSSLKIDSADYANYYLEYDRFPVNIVVNYFRRDAKRTCEIVMEDETWTIDLLKDTVISSSRGELFNARQKTKMYEDQMRYFTECIRQNKQPMNTLEESLEVLKICLNETT